MAGNDGDGDGHGKHEPPVADIVSLADLFATHCHLEFKGEYFRLVFLTEAVVIGAGALESELIPACRVVMPPSGLMALAEAVLAHYVRKTG